MYIFPPINKEIKCKNSVIEQLEDYNVFNKYNIKAQKKVVKIEVKKIKDSKATIKISEDQFEGLKDIILRINYEGNIGYLFINVDLINDNLCNGSVWEISLDRFKEEEMYIYISPIKKVSKVTNYTTMAGRVEIAKEEIAEINSINVVGIYKIEIHI